MANMYAEWTEAYMMSTLASELTAIFVIIFLDLLLLVRFLKNKKEEVKHLMIMLFLMWSSIITGVVPQLLAWWDVDTPFQFGIPVGGGYFLWYDNIGYSIISLSYIPLFNFMKILFLKPEETHRNIFLGGLLVFNAFNLHYGIFVFEQNTSSLSPLTSMLFGILSLYAWGCLFLFANHDAHKLEKSVFRLGLKLIAYSSVCMIICFGLWVFNMSIVRDLAIYALSWVFYIFTAFLLYLGYILPNWFRVVYSKMFPNRKSE